VSIGNHVWVDYRAIVLPGVTIGARAVGSAGIVVTRDAPLFALVAGSSVRPISEYLQAIEYLLYYNLSPL
jgi:maltose O-acetyltransferase